MKRIDQRPRFAPGAFALQACDRRHPECLSPPRFEPVSSQWTSSNQMKTAPWAHIDIYPKLLYKMRFRNVPMLGTRFAISDTKFIQLKGMQR